MAQIHEALPKVSADVGSIKKQQSQGLNYPYRGIEALQNALGPVLIKHGITLGIECSEHKLETKTRTEVVAARGNFPEKTTERLICHVTLRMQVTLFAQDGSAAVFTTYGEGMDYNGDKATNKAMATAFKYAMFLGLCIPVEAKELDDPDNFTPEQTSGIADRQASNGNGNGHPQPNDTTSDISVAVSALRNAPTKGKVNVLVAQAKKKAADGGYTADQFKRIEDEAAKRIAELTPVEATT